MNIYEIDFDVSKRPSATSVLYLGQGDKNGTTLEAAIYDGGSALALTGKSARFCMRTPNGAGYYECDGTVSGNTATFLIDETYAAAVDGITDVAYVEILEGSTVICSTNRFRVVVLQNATEDADPSQAYNNGIIEATNRANAAAEAAEEVLSDGIPLMAASRRGGAKLGAGLEVDENEALNVNVGSGLTVDNGALSLGDLTQSGSGAEVATDGCAIYSVSGEGWSDQETTTGKNLLPNTRQEGQSKTANGITFTTNDDGSITVRGTATAATNYVLISHATAQSLISRGSTYTMSFSPVPSVAKCAFWNGSTSTASSGIGSITVTVPSSGNWNFYVSVANGATVDETFYPQIEAGSTATSYEPYTGGAPSPSPDYPQKIEVARGRNLLQGCDGESTGSYPFNHSFNINPLILPITVAAGETVTFSFDAVNIISASLGIILIYKDGTSESFYTSTDSTVGRKAKSITPAKPITACGFYSTNASLVVANLQLELGSTPSPYVPYGHIGLEVTHDGTTTVTPIPLPTKGFAASLPDGTADALTVDSAGRWEWVNESDEVVLDGDEAWGTATSSPNNYYIRSNSSDSGFSDIKIAGGGSNPNGVSILCDHFTFAGAYEGHKSEYGVTVGGTSSATDLAFDWRRIDESLTLNGWKTWLATHPVTVLYPLATPTTESGYIDLPALPSGATVSCKELDEIGVSWFVDGCEPIVEHAANMARRETEENESIEDALAELAARVAALES